MTDVPIMPAVFSYKTNGTFYDYTQRTFEYGGHVKIKVLEPVMPADFESAGDMAEECRKRMQASLSETEA